MTVKNVPVYRLFLNTGFVNVLRWAQKYLKDNKDGDIRINVNISAYHMPALMSIATITKFVEPRSTREAASSSIIK